MPKVVELATSQFSSAEKDGETAVRFGGSAEERDPSRHQGVPVGGRVERSDSGEGQLQGHVRCRRTKALSGQEGRRVLTEKEIGAELPQTTDFQHIKYARVRLRSVGLSDEEVGEKVDKIEAAAGNWPVHVLVVAPKCAHDSASENLAWQKRIVLPWRIANLDPVRSDDFSVPIETIAVFQQIYKGFLKAEELGHPLLDTLCVEEESRCWGRLGKAVDAERACCDDDSFTQLATRDEKRLCLVFDEMDNLFGNDALATKFLKALNKWKAAFYFCEFLGVGSHDVVIHLKNFWDGNNPLPFSMVQVKPFSVEQRRAFFELLEPHYAFSKSLRSTIMEYSSGAPSAIGSIIQFTVDNSKWTDEKHQWESWFKANAFSV